jgi:hypothetical protein
MISLCFIKKDKCKVRPKYMDLPKIYFYKIYKIQIILNNIYRIMPIRKGSF